jgi:hypothetical protein
MIATSPTSSVALQITIGTAVKYNQSPTEDRPFAATRAASGRLLRRSRPTEVGFIGHLLKRHGRRPAVAGTATAARCV